MEGETRDRPRRKVRHQPEPRNSGPSRTAQPVVKDRIVELRRVRASELTPDPQNWRRHPPGQASALRALLDQIGWADACLARQANRGLVLIDGHLRREVALDALLPVLVLDVTEEEAHTLLATLDPLAGMAIADEDALRALLATAVVPDALLLAHIEGLIPSTPRPGKCDPDAIPATPKKSSVTPGELWVMGEHRLLCGDACSPKDMKRVTGGSPADLLWTDPPYGVGYVGKTRDGLTLANDDASGVDGLLERAFEAVDRAPPPRLSSICGAPRGGPLGHLRPAVRGGGVAPSPELGVGQGPHGAGARRLPLPARAHPVRLQARSGTVGQGPPGLARGERSGLRP